MKQFLKIAIVILFSIGIALIMHSCKKPVVPVVTTASVSGITQISATSGGNVTDDGGAEVTARGICWGTTQNPTTSSSKTSDGTGTGSFTSSITGLSPGGNYFARAYATNSIGTSYGNEVTFASNPILLATLTTSAATSITSTTAASGGNISSDGGGTITARGVCWSKSQNPTTANSKTTNGTGTGTFTSNISGLSSSTKYYVRAYATNGAGDAYGDEKSFSTEQVKDADGNIYTSVTIGTQVWMGENLKTTKLNDGTLIPYLDDFIDWELATAPAYCWPDRDPGNKNPYGALYNWFTASSGKLCPSGWHVPSNTEWVTLQTYLGGIDVAGGKLKEVGTTHWESPNTGATNEYGFTALPAGFRGNGLNDGGIYSIGYSGWFWTVTEFPGQYQPPIGYCWMLENNLSKLLPSNLWSPQGLSVRCLKD